MQVNGNVARQLQKARPFQLLSNTCEWEIFSVSVQLLSYHSLKSDPHSLRFHRYQVLINNSFFNQAVDIYPVRRDQRHKIIVHFKIYSNMELFHAV